MNPLEAFGQALISTWANTTERRPGAIIKRLTAEAREALKGLTSDEMVNLRAWPEGAKRRGRFNA